MERAAGRPCAARAIARPREMGDLDAPSVDALELMLERRMARTGGSPREVRGQGRQTARRASGPLQPGMPMAELPYAAENLEVPPGGESHAAEIDQQHQLAEQLLEPGAGALLGAGFVGQEEGEEGEEGEGEKEEGGGDEAVIPEGYVEVALGVPFEEFLCWTAIDGGKIGWHHFVVLKVCIIPAEHVLETYEYVCWTTLPSHMYVGPHYLPILLLVRCSSHRNGTTSRTTRTYSAPLQSRSVE